MVARKLVKALLGTRLRRALKEKALGMLAPELYGPGHKLYWLTAEKSPLLPSPSGCAHEKTVVDREEPRRILRCVDCDIAFPADQTWVDADQTNYYTPEAFDMMYKSERGRLPSLWDSLVCHVVFLHGSAIMLSDPPNNRALDVGCGGGHFLKFLHGYCGFEVTGLDPAEHAIRHAREVFGLPNIVQASTPDEAELPDDHYGFTSLIHTLEHVPDPLDILKQIYRVTAPGGAFFGEVPDSRFFHDWDHIEHRWFFSEKSLDYHLRCAGFTVERIFPGRALPWPEPIAFLSWHARKPG